jgi:hypothetical protein
MTKDLAGCLERRVLQNISYHARRLAKDNAVPGMEASDYQQDLQTDLIKRARSFDPQRASFPTFADRVVRHRVSTLRSLSVNQKAERRAVSLNEPITMPDGSQRPIEDLVPDDKALTEDDLLIRIDMHRFAATLTARDLEGCELLLSDSLSEGVRQLGINRSTGYDRIRRLRDRAIKQGLSGRLSRNSGARTVSGRTLNKDSDMHAQPIRPAITTTQAAFQSWLAVADAGDVLKYHRGFLAADRTSQVGLLSRRDQQELHRLATSARDAFQRGQVHLLQRRYGPSDYEYVAIARSSLCGGCR